jgi:Kef-type K+ transport system membrane component KefB
MPLANLAVADSETTRLLLTSFAVFAAAKLMAELFEWLHQPGVVGEIVAGVVIGPSVLGWVNPDQFLSALAELGVIFLLFTVGLEIKPAQIFQVGGAALLVAAGGVAAPFIAGWAIMLWWNHSSVEAIFVGASMVATSVGITARVLASLGLMNERASQIILAAAVIDDILGLLVLAAVSGVAKGGLHYAELAGTAALAFGFTIFVAVVGTRAMRRVGPRLAHLRQIRGEFAFALLLVFGLSLLATWAGVAAIVGAFLAGMVLAEHFEGSDVHQLAQGATELVVPFFLVQIGLYLDIRVFQSLRTFGLALLITAAAIITKLAGCGLGAWSLGFRDALRVGMGMAPRGEVGMVVAQIGLTMGVISGDAYAVVVFMAIATTLVAPPLLRLLFPGARPAEAEADASL